jgi:predicted ATPase
VQHRYRWSHTGTEESAPILLECLRELGIKDIKINLSKKELMDLYSATRKEVLRLGMHNILKLPVCNSRLIKTRLSILEELCLWAYWTKDLKAMLSVGARFILKTLKYGTTPTTGVGFVFFGIAVMQLFKAYEFGEQIGEVGVALCNNYGGNAESARARYLYASFLSSWKHSYHKSIPLARLAMKQGLLGGDRFYATFAHIYVVGASLLAGDNLSDTLREAKHCLEESESLGHTVGSSIIATTLIRVIVALQGKTTLGMDIFDAPDFQESLFIQEMAEIHRDHDVQLSFYYTMKSIVLAFYGFYEFSFKLSSEYTHIADAVPSSRQTHLMFFLRCISIIRLIRTNHLGIE